MLSFQQVSDLMNHGHQVFRLHRSRPVKRDDRGELVIEENGKTFKVIDHFKPWAYEVDTETPGQRYIVGPKVGLTHHYTHLISFHPDGEDPLTLLLGVREGSMTLDDVTEMAIEHMISIGHSKHAEFPVLTI